MPYSNPIIGGGGDLIRDQIRSPDFVTGVSGWEISRDGTAEFNEATVRGLLHVAGTSGTIDIAPDPTRPTISLWNTLHNNRAFINVVDDFDPNNANIGVNGGQLAGVAIPGSTIYPRLYMISPSEGASGLGFIRKDVPDIIGGQLLFTDGAAFLRAYIGDGTLVATADVQVIRDGAIILKGSTDGVTRNGPELRVGGAPSGGYLHVANEDWTNITVNSGAGFAGNAPQVKKYADGKCMMLGGITGHALAGATVIATIPAGYRPLKDFRFVAATEGAGGINKLFVDSATGQIQIATAAVNSSWFTGIHYPIV